MDGLESQYPEPAAWRWRQAQGQRFKGLTEQEGEAEWSEPFLFAILADTQLGAMDENEKWDDDVALCEEAVRQLNHLQPKFAIVCGDLVHHVPQMYPDTDPEIRTRQVLDFKKAFAGLDETIPLLCVCGNHDVGNAPNKVTLDRYSSEFGDDYFGFWVGGVAGLVINTSLVYDPTQVQAQYERQQAWLAQEMAAAKAKGAMHILVFGHHPLFLKSDEEGDDDTVLGVTTFTTRKGQEVTIANSYFHLPLERRLPLLRLMKEHGSRFFFSGHFHQNAVSVSEAFGVTNVITSAVGMQLGQDRSGFRLVKVFEDEIVHRYFALDEMPSAPVSLNPARKADWGDGGGGGGK